MSQEDVDPDVPTRSGYVDNFKAHHQALYNKHVNATYVLLEEIGSWSTAQFKFVDAHFRALKGNDGVFFGGNNFGRGLVAIHLAHARKFIYTLARIFKESKYVHLATSDNSDPLEMNS